MNTEGALSKFIPATTTLSFPFLHTCSMRAAITLRVLATDLLRRRHTPQPLTLPHQSSPSFYLTLEGTFSLISIHSDIMGSSAARKARRRQKNRGSHNLVAPPTIVRDSVNSDEAERRHEEMQLITGVPCLLCPGNLRPGHSSQLRDHINDFDSDTSDRSSANASQQEAQPQLSPNSVARGSASKGADALAGVSLQQRQTKNQKKRDLVELSHDSHCSLESSAYLASHLLEETLRTIRDMTPEDAAIARVHLEEFVATHGGPVPGEPGQVRLPIPFPVFGGLLPPSGLFSDKQSRTVLHAFLDKVVELTDEPLPGACVIKNLSKAVSPVLSAVGNMDGASQSAEIVTMEEKTPRGGQMDLAKHDFNDDKNDAAKLKEQVRPGKICQSHFVMRQVKQSSQSCLQPQLPQLSQCMRASLLRVPVACRTSPLRVFSRRTWLQSRLF